MKPLTLMLRAQCAPFTRENAFLTILMASFVTAQTTPTQNESQSTDSEVVQLDPFEVAADSNAGYGAQSSSSSSRLNLAYIDVPQTVNVVTSEFLADAFIFDSHDFSMYVTGVTPRSNTHQEETYFMRGLQTTTSYIEGFLATRAVNRDAALYNRVEFVKGPASAAIGRGEAGGLVNFVQKKPNGKKMANITTTVGTDSFYRVAVDYNTPLLPNGKLDLRMPFYYEDSENPRGGSLMHSNKYGIGPAVAWRPFEHTDINLTTAFFVNETPGAVGSAHWMNKDLVDMRVDQNGINPNVWYPSATTPLVPFSNIYTYPDNFRRAKVAEGSFIINHRFNEHLSFRQGFRAERIINDVQRFNTPPAVAKNANLPSGYQITMAYVRNHDEYTGYRAQSDLLYETDFRNTFHTFLFGFDTYDNHNHNQNGSRGGLTLDLYQPDLTPPANFDYDTYVKVNNNGDNLSWSDGYGYYAQYSGRLLNDKVFLMAGWRKDKTSIESQNLRTGTARTNPREETTEAPRYSVSFKLRDWLSLYYVHSIQADPPETKAKWGTDTLLNGATSYTDGRRDPSLRLTSSVRATLNEVGAKGNFFDGKITASIAYYEISRDGFIQSEVKAEPGANGIGTIQYTENFIAQGENASGVEIEIFGQPTPRLTMVLSAVSQDGTNPRANGTIQPIDILMDELSFNGKYSFRDANKNGFEVTLGGKYWLGGWTISNGSLQTFDDDQYVINGGISYYWKNGQFSLTARSNNLLNDTIIITENSQYMLRRSYLAFNARF